MTVETVIFDFDGTIADSLHLFVEIAADLFNIDDNVGTDLLEELRGMRRNEVLDRLDISRLQALWSYRTGKRRFAERIDEVYPFEGMPELLDSLHGTYTVGIVTDNDVDTVESFISQHDLPSFSFIRSNSIFESKAWALKRLEGERDIDLSETVYVGDQITDVEAAHEANCAVVAVDWGYNTASLLESGSPHRVVSSPNGLLGVIQSL